ncbi:hypothetical protein BDM02DRAFT_3086441 [Thelephora ganbajun]|uniref:Uncharacterized protein n=1 Tax=Thelephora ganbajun TaxID=370292 RepID=A0ACB6ZXH4_THEGA|nr:hypothetical protein BDM02DRAFT_3086441 [Thelephora ganbajun]
MHFNLRRSLSVSAAPSSLTPAKYLQTATTNANDHSDHPVATESPLLPAPAVAKEVTPRSRRNSKSVQISGGWRAYCTAFKKRVTSGTAPSTPSSPDDSNRVASHIHEPQEPVACEQDGHVDVVVVDRMWGEDSGWSTKSDSNPPFEEIRAENKLGTTNTDPDSSETDSGFWASSPVLFFLRWRIWPPIWGFFRLRFVDHKFEAHYVKETWFLRKRLALFSAAFFVINWLLSVILITRPVTLPDAIFFYGVGPAISVPLVFFVVFDYSRDHSLFYQIYLLFAVWPWPVYQVVSVRYTSALQTMALFGLGMNRFPALLGSICFVDFDSTPDRSPRSLVLFLPVRPKYGRNAANVVVFEIFILYVHYIREVAERRLFTLRDQLKTQFKATQKAQVNERKTADSKRRLTSWVRVPLNTALLAVQNMSACNAVDKSHEVEFQALEGSLSMMSKGWLLTINSHRMDSGKFESCNKPYVFHQIMRSLVAPLKLDADSKKLHFVTELDRTIDDVAGRAFFSALGHNEEEIQKAIAKYDGVVLGDENRLRQIITNLAGNAFKFTPAGGTVTIKTKLVIPSPNGPPKASQSASPPFLTSPASQESLPPSRSPSHRRETKNGSTVEDKGEGDSCGLSADLLNQHNAIVDEKTKPLERIVARIEVCDTGCGIHEKEMNEIKLFNAFNQTEVGRQQGGKGTGLGLALVRQIVKLSSGRLGLKSKVGEGSTFWVELPLGVGKKVLPPDHELPIASRAGSMDRPPSLASSQLHTEKVQAASAMSTTLLKRVTCADGLVQLVPKNADDIPEPVPALKESIGVLRTRSLDRPPLTKHEPNTTASTDETAKAATVEKAEISTPASPKQDSPPPLSTMTQRRARIDLPKPPQFPTIRSSGDRLSPSFMRPPTPENVGSVEITPGLPVLVVDDDKMTRMLMQRMLERLKCVVTTAVNGQEALELIAGVSDSHRVDTPGSNEGEYFADGRVASSSASRGTGGPSTHGMSESKFALVFLDNQMPVLSGVETVRKLRKLGRKDLIVGVTGNALLPDQEEYLAAGVDYILTKPVREENLRSMLLIGDEQQKSRTVSPPLMEPPQNQNTVGNLPT